MNPAHHAITQEILSKKSLLLLSVRNRVERDIRSLSPKSSLTFKLSRPGFNQRTVQPSASAEYARVLISFCRGEDFEKFTIESKVTEVTMQSIEAEFTKFFSSEGLSRDISNACISIITKLRPGHDSAHHEIRNFADQTKDDIKRLGKKQMRDTVVSTVSDATGEKLQAFLASSVGQNLVTSIGTTMATTTGKALIIKTLNIVVMKVMASAALKTAIIGMIKKVGIGFIVKSIIGKAIVALLAAVGLANIPLLWVLIPLLAGFFAYEYTKFPEKLADTVPQEVERVISEKFQLIADQIGAAVLDEVLTELSKKVSA
jgi:hypothetical protein